MTIFTIFIKLIHYFQAVFKQKREFKVSSTKQFLYLIRVNCFSHKCSKVFLQVLLQLERARLRSVALHRVAVLVHDKLGKVPLDGIEQGAALLLLQELPQRVRFVPVDVNLGEQIKLGALLLLGELFNLLVGLRLLVRELVRRERQNAETCAGRRMKC